MGYSSKYYNPEKAHEYYMKHRKLKGRKKGNNPTSTAGLNEKGKAAAKMVREQINAEKKERIKQISADLKNRVAQLRAELKERMNGLSPDQKAQLKEELKSQIGAMREAVKAVKAQVREQYKNVYIGELQKIKADASMRKGKKKKGNKK